MIAASVGAAVDVVMSGPVKLDLRFSFPRPKSHYGTGKNSSQLKGSAPVEHAQRPDIDNLVKAAMDAMNGVLYDDDKQVVSLSASKVWALQPDQAGVVLTVGCV